MLSSLEAFPEVQQMPAFSPCLIILSFLPNMFLVASLTLCTFSSSSPSPKFNHLQPWKRHRWRGLVSSLSQFVPLCFGEIASAHTKIQEKRMRAHEPTPAGSVWHLLPSSQGYRDVWDEGWSVPIRRDRRQMLGGKHGCSPLREAQVPDEGSAFLGGTGSAKHMLHPGLSPAEEGSRGCSHTAYMGATTLFKELQSTLTKKVITHRSHQLRCGGRDDVHTNSGFIFFSFLTWDVLYGFANPMSVRASWMLGFLLSAMTRTYTGFCKTNVPIDFSRWFFPCPV